MSKKTIILSSSSLNSIQLCPQRYDYEINNQLSPVNKGKAMEKGTLFHTFLEYYYKGIMFNDKVENLNNRIPVSDIVSNAILKVREQSVSMNIEMDEVDEVIQFGTEYVLFYQNDGWTPVAVEEQFNAVLFEDDNFRIVITGKIDLIVNTAKQNLTILVDHKTGSRNKPPLKLSTQFQLYCLAMGYNNVEVNKINWVKDPSNRFHRYLLNYDSHILEEFRQDTIYWAMEIVKHSETGFYPRNRTSCDKYNTGCPFVRLCESVPGSRQYKIDKDFVKNETYHLFVED
jgi:hypothetical protein